jgi:hypothetical protein
MIVSSLGEFVWVWQSSMVREKNPVQKPAAPSKKPLQQPKEKTFNPKIDS